MRLWASAEGVRFAGSEVTEANFLIRFLRRIRFSGTTGRPGLRNAYPTRDTSMTDPIRKILCIGAILVLTSIVVVATSNAKQDQPIKKSQSGICHCPGGAYYDRTKRFTPFRTIDECLSDGGRHPKRGQGVNGGAKLVHPGGAKLVHLTLCGTRCWGVVPVVHRRDPRCFAPRNASATRSSAGPSYGLPATGAPRSRPRCRRSRPRRWFPVHPPRAAPAGRTTR